MIFEREGPGCLFVLDHVATVRAAHGPCEDLLGHRPDSVVGAPLTRFLARDQVRPFLRYLWTCREATGVVPFESRFKQGGDVLVLCRARTSDRGFDALVVPVGPDLKQRLGLQEEQVQAGLAIEDIPLALLVIGNREPGLLRMNRTARRLFGYTSAERLHWSISRLLPSLSWTGPLPADWTATTAVARDGRRFAVEVAFQTVRQEQWVWVRDVSDVQRSRSVFIDLTEEERRRMGRELHDSLGQHLTGLTMLSGTLAEAADEESPEVARQAARVAALARDVVRRTRHLARGLFPPDLEDRNVGAALQDLATSLQDIHGVECLVRLRPGRITMPEARDATHLFRIAQEALTNSIRHGGARRVHVDLEVEGDQFRLEIRDEGRGFPPGPRRRGAGLRSIRHRAEAMGAALEFTERPGGGVTVRCWRGPGFSVPSEAARSARR